MTTAERRKTRLSAFFVVCIAGFILTVAYFMLFVFAGSGLDDDFGIIKLGFMAFFTLITLFIVGVRVLDAVRASKMVCTGVVTAKEIRASRRKNADSLAQFVVILDNSECTVDGDTFKKINVGETIVLTTTRSGNAVLEIRKLDDSLATNDVDGRDVLEPMDDETRRLAWWLFVKSIAGRLILVGLIAGLPVIGIVVAYTIDPSLLSHPLFTDTYRIVQMAIPLIGALLLLRRPWNIIRDITRGQTLNEVRTIRDVVTSDRRLVGKTGSTSGSKLLTIFTYVNTIDGFYLCKPFPIPVVGNQVVISRLPRTRVLLGVYVLE